MPYTKSDNKTTVSEKDVRPSIRCKMIRHAESRNNQVYRNARYIYRGGTPAFDEAGWWQYVNTHRSHDPSLSDEGVIQAKKLAEYLGPHLQTQASQPVHVICSPMRRTLETIRPTVEYLVKEAHHPVFITVNGFYYESDGCHIKDTPKEGMNPQQITELMYENLIESSQQDLCSLEFVGFPDSERGWYCNATGAETRAQSEERAAKFYLWLTHTFDGELNNSNSVEDIFDAGVRVPGEEEELDFDYFAPRLRRRRTYLLVGHGDFMSLVLKRVMAGYGYAIEHDGIPHRSAMVHHNTGMTELEYFGQGRFLLMQHNATPHLNHPSLLSGGSLKDGWSYIVPTDDAVMQPVEVKSAFADELSDHVREQSRALRALYLSSTPIVAATDDAFTVEQDNVEEVGDSSLSDKHFVVQRGHQVVAVATYSQASGIVTDVAVQPGATGAREALLQAVQEHARKLKRSGSLVVHPRTAADEDAFVQAGFYQAKDKEYI